jgi:hypothetical protein
MWATGRLRLWQPPEAVEVKPEVPACGNMFVGGRQVWLGPALAGRVVTIWVDQSRLHVILDGQRLKLLPSGMGPPQLTRLVRAGAIPTGPAPLPELAEHGDGVDVDRTVNASGLVSLAGRYYSIGYHLAGQRVTLRLKGNGMAVLAGNKLLRTVACTVPPEHRAWLQGARPSPKEPLVVSDPITVDRRVSASGLICVATQRTLIGKAHAGKTVTVHVGRLSCESTSSLASRWTSLAQPTSKWPGSRFGPTSSCPAPTLPENLRSFVNHQLIAKRNA